MGMAGIVQHNMSAAFGARNLGIVTGSKAKSAEKLASGYKINRSADDAAGLSISEKMRRLIRGLDQGADNIEDGISLCQIADGALDEVGSVLQRVRVLSIQAYNGTNSKNDRQIIQNEVESCLGEIDEIKERTKFNEIYILRGDQAAVKSKATSRTIEIKEVYTTPVKVTEFEPRVFPDWVVFNDGTDKLISHDYTNYDAEPSDEMVMLNDYEVTIDGKTEKIKVYFGMKQGSGNYNGYEYISDYVNRCETAEPESDLRKQYDALLASNEKLRDFVNNPNYRTTDVEGNYTGFTYEGWTETQEDNVSCKIDLGGLKNASQTVDQLYSNIDQLLGCEIGFPCGTCEKMQILRFSGSTPEHNVINFSRMGAYWQYYNKDVEISLSEYSFEWNDYAEDGSVSGTKEYNGYFEAIDSLRKISDADQQASELASLADKIASDLATRMKDTFEKVHTKGDMNHFDRAAMDKTSDQILYVYDYRDREVLSTDSAANSYSLTSTGYVTHEYTVYEEGIHTRYETVPLYPKHDGQIKIQASANSSDIIPLELREISRDTLNLEDYTVAGYTYESVLTDNYYRKLRQYEKDMIAYEEKLNDVEYETKTGTTQVKIIDQAAQIDREVIDLGYKDGEHQGYDTKVTVISPEISHYEERTYEYKVPIGDLPEEPQKPEEEYVWMEYYTPSPLELIDNAMNKVNDLRSYFGAMQNRLEHSYANNKNAQENLEASESRIRDTDMAEEMVFQSKSSIIQQAGQAMLAQVNSSREGLLRLLE